MPGTPPTTPRLAIPRFATTDPDQVPTHLNQVSDQVDTLAARIDSGLAAAPPAAGIVNRFYRETDTGILRIDTGSALAHITPGPHASRHQDGGADPLTVREAMMATGAVGPLKGLFSAYRNAALSLVTGGTVAFDTEEADLSNWFDVTTNIGRYTPQVAGWYRLSWCVTSAIAFSAGIFFHAALMKNGTLLKNGLSHGQSGSSQMTSVGTALVLANGTTDFFTIGVFQGSGASAGLTTGAANTYFQGHLVGRP